MAQTRRGSEEFWGRVKRWFLVAAGVGLMVGLAVTALERVVVWIWSAIEPGLGPVTTVLYPTIGLALSGLCLQFLTVNPEVHGTEEVIEAFHERKGVFRFRSFPGKMLAAIATLGFGGSAGLEGPSIYAGGALGSFALRKLRRRLSFDDDDVRILMVAGAAAGVAAVFKAPLTGIIFALEVPYRDDLTREALIPSLVASVVSYLVLVQFLGVAPLFRVSERFSPTTTDLFYAILLGVVVGLLAKLFVASFHFYSRLARRTGFPLWVRTTLGGLLTGLFGLASLYIFDKPLALGVGYETVNELIVGTYTPGQAGMILVLKAGAVLATLACGAAGGIFVPMIVLGADTGAILKGILPGTVGPMFPIVGMAAFLAAGYNTPIAATVFIAETTGGAGYLIPGLIAAAVAFTVAGRTSVSHMQRWRRETRFDRMLRLRVADIMIHHVDALHDDCTVEKFVTDHMVHMRHKSMPVIDANDELVGMVALSDVGRIPREEWEGLKLADVMVADVFTAQPQEIVGDIVALMAEKDVDRVPVVEPHHTQHLVGIISSTDVLALSEASAEWRRRRRERYRSR